MIEAVFEDSEIKKGVTEKSEAVLKSSAIFASNTSTIPITGLAKNSKRPKNFIGIHFFSPVDKMNLVEIIRGKDTSDTAVAKALDYVRQIRKTPIVVNDARFFYANRCIIPYINEGIRMVAEGVEPALVENAATFAREGIELVVWSDGEHAGVDISDDGPGFRPRSSAASASLTSRPGSATANIWGWGFSSRIPCFRATEVRYRGKTGARASGGKTWPAACGGRGKIGLYRPAVLADSFRMCGRDVRVNAGNSWISQIGDDHDP